MSLTPVKCTYCGGELQVVNIYQPVICPYCHSTFVIQPDINNYNTTNNINANVVNITYNITQQVPPERENSNSKQSNSDFIIEDNVLKAYTGHSSIVNIPYGVIEIATGCFMGRCGISKVTIPDTVIKIGTQAFKNCIDLKEIVASPRIKKMYSSMFESGIGVANKSVDLEKSYGQQSSYGNKLGDSTYKSPQHKSVAREYVKEHPEQFSEKSRNMSSGEVDFWNAIGKIMENPTGYKIVQGTVVFLALCPIGTLAVLVQGKDFVGIEFLPIVTVIEIIFAIIYWIAHSGNDK